MLKLQNGLMFFCYIVCIVQFSLSLEVNDTGVCRFPHDDDGTTWELKCCQNYKLHPNAEECIDCPNGTYGVNCMEKCSLNHYGFRCMGKCNCFYNETCNKVTGCEEMIKINDTNFGTTKSVITSVITVPIVAIGIGVLIFLVSREIRHRLKIINPFNFLFTRKQPVFVQSRHKTSDIDIEDDDPYSEIRESMMVRPMTVYGRKLSIRSSYIDPDDPYHHIELATSLRRPNRNSSTTEYTDYTEPIDEPFLQPKNNIYEQLIIEELTETPRNSDNAIYEEVGKSQNSACSPQKQSNTSERSDKCNLATEDDNTEDKGDNFSERETNTSEISDKTDVVKEIKDNTKYAKVVKKSKNECQSKINLNTTGISDKLNFVIGTNDKMEISENSTKPIVPTTDNEGEMTTFGEAERKNSTIQCEEDNSNKNVGLNKIISDCGDTPVVISVSVGNQRIFLDLKDCNVLNSLSNDVFLENAITSEQSNVTKK